MFAIVAEFTIKPDQIDAFKDLIAWQAERSVADEEGCHLFDVCQDEDGPGRFLLYELYTDAHAFDEGHMKIPRFEEFIGKAEPMMTAEPMVKRLNRLFAHRK